MALFSKMSSDLKAQRDALVFACEETMDQGVDQSGSDPYLAARDELFAFDEEHGLTGEAETIMADLIRNGFMPMDADKPWSVIEIHDVVLEKLGQDLDLEDTELFGDLLQLFN